jgi:hypothetical protein
MSPKDFRGKKYRAMERIKDKYTSFLLVMQDTLKYYLLLLDRDTYLLGFKQEGGQAVNN